MQQPWTHSNDPLGGALHFLRMTGTFYARSEFTAPWGVTLPAFKGSMMFHVVTAGECWIEVAGEDGRWLRAGDLVLVPHGEGHRLMSAPGARTVNLLDAPREMISERYEHLRLGGGGAPATVICGVVGFEHPVAHRLLEILPRLIAVDSWNSPEGDWIQSTLRFMALEAREPRPGGETVITRLADILVIQAIRAWLARDPASQKGWLGALRDRQIGRALAAIHRKPAETWSLEALAAEAAMSRSAFAARFTELVGESAMHYVARWRMTLALGWLRETEFTLAEMATRLGYESEAAFSRAFKRVIGTSPGQSRRQALSKNEGLGPIQDAPKKPRRHVARPASRNGR